VGVATASPAAAAIPKSCSDITTDWWFTPVDVGTPLYHFVVADKPVKGGDEAYVCVWLVGDRKVGGGHTSKLHIARPGKDIYVKSTKKWTLMTPKPFHMYAGTKFKAIADVTVKNPARKSGKSTVHRTLTVNIGQDGVPI
jgi:hypothetical protein